MAHRLLPERSVSQALLQHGQPLPETLCQRTGIQHIGPAGGELDGQRQAINTPAELRNRRPVRRGQDQLGLPGACSLHKESDGRHAHYGSGRRVAWSGDGQGRHVQHLLTPGCAVWPGS